MECDHQSQRRLWRALAAALILLLSQAAAQILPGYGDGGGGGEAASFFFSDFEENLQDLALLGDAKFVRIEGQADGMAVQLSGTRKNTVGRLLYGQPINLLDSAARPVAFSTCFEFSMTSFAGDGLAFVIVPDKISIGASGPWLGLVDEQQISSPHTFAVEFDSVMNAELRDPNGNHVGVDVETILSAVTANASDMAVVLNDGSRNFAWIDYDGGVLEVRIGKDGAEKPRGALLVHRIDLAAVWRPWMFVGFSSSTGVNWQKHKIFSWRFVSGAAAAGQNSLPPLVESGKPGAVPASDRGGGAESDRKSAISASGAAISGRKSAISARESADRGADAAVAAPDEQDGGDSAPSVYRFDADLLVTLVVGFICGASVVLFLLAGWALISSRRNSRRSDGGGEYQEIS